MDSPTPVPAADPVVETTPAVDAAVVADDPRAYKEARAAERLGKPLAAVPTVEPDPATEPVAPKLTRRERDQQDANERTRKAVEAATADLLAENARLKAERQPPAPRAPDPTSAEPVAEWKRLVALPNAPKLANFESVEEHAAAMALFVNQTLHEERTAADRQRTESDSLTAAQKARSDNFIKQLDAAAAADAEFVKALTPEVLALETFESARHFQRPVGPKNVIAEQLHDSPVAPQMLRYLSQHPAELTRLTTVPPSLASLPDRERARAHTAWMVKEFGKLEGRFDAPNPPAVPSPKTLTDAPDPAPALGTRVTTPADPVASALTRDDPRAYKLAMAAKRRR